MSPFNELIKRLVEPILVDKGFVLTEERKNFLHYESSRLKIRFAYDPRGENIVYIYRDSCYSLADSTISEVFGGNETINTADSEVFAENLRTFFLNEGASLLGEDQTAITRFEEYMDRASKEYTRKVSRR